MIILHRREPGFPSLSHPSPKLWARTAGSHRHATAISLVNPVWHKVEPRALNLDFHLSALIKAIMGCLRPPASWALEDPRRSLSRVLINWTTAMPNFLVHPP